jgi:hypothetical protein
VQLFAARKPPELGFLSQAEVVQLIDDALQPLKKAVAQVTPQRLLVLAHHHSVLETNPDGVTGLVRIKKLVAARGGIDHKAKERVGLDRDCVDHPPKSSASLTDIIRQLEKDKEINIPRSIRLRKSLIDFVGLVERQTLAGGDREQRQKHRIWSTGPQ